MSELVGRLDVGDQDCGEVVDLHAGSVRPRRRGGKKRRPTARPPARLTTITDADLHKLFPPGTPQRGNAIALMTKLKAMAHGSSKLERYDRTLWTALGWSEATFRRVKKAVRDGGVQVTTQHHSHGGAASTIWLLDRRSIEALAPEAADDQICEGVVSEVTALSIDLQNNPSLGDEDRVSEGVGWRSPRGSPAVPCGAGEPTAEIESELEPGGERQPAPEVAELAAELERQAGAELDRYGGSWARAVDGAMRRLVARGRGVFEVRLARQELEASRRVSLDVGTDNCVVAVKDESAGDARPEEAA